MKKESTFKSAISGIEYSDTEKVSCKIISKSIYDLMKEEHPSLKERDFIASKELNLYREKYIANYLTKGIGELSVLESKVMSSFNENQLIVNKLEDESSAITFGQKIADKVASFGGSWTFIIAFGIFILIWIGSNIYFLANKGFDPYPFILLNLILSCLAALQAPVIMMSQNRQEEKDRERAKNDYMINLKSELEIRMLHEKLDHLMLHQQQELIEIQKVQIEMMNDILVNLKADDKSKA
jgi:uncharacterized membrane protein